MSNLFVANLNYRITQDDLVKIFSPYGNVESTKVVMDREKGQSKGFGFVVMSDAKDAIEAIKGLHDKEIDGRKMVVKEAEAR